MSELQVGSLLLPTYEWAGVGFSVLAAFLGSLLALVCARRIVRVDGTLDQAMLACAAVSLGGIAIWSMHFIGMAAYRLPIAINYNIVLTAISLAAAIVISAAALYLAGGRSFNRKGWLAGALLAGIGVCVMHYLGMYAMTMRADMSMDPGLVAASIVIAIGAAAAALWLAFNLKQFVHQLIAAAVMAVAVCAMHYTGMAAADMICTPPVAPGNLVIGGSSMGLGVFGVSGCVLLGILWVVTGRMMGGAPRAAV